MNRTGIASLIGSERPGYSRGQFVQEYMKENFEPKDDTLSQEEISEKKQKYYDSKGEGIKLFDKERREYFRNPNIILMSRERSEEFPDDIYESTVKPISKGEFDPAKIRDGTQLIVKLDPKTQEPIYDGSGLYGTVGFEDAPFLFYAGPDDVRRQLDITDKYLSDNFGMFAPSSLYGKPFADDASFLDKTTERLKTGARGLYGFVKNLPEMGIGAYRFINPIDALGGIGPYDTMFPKSEAQQKQVDNMYNVPGYTGEDGFTGVDAFQTPPSFLDPNPKLYKDTLKDDLLNEKYEQAVLDTEAAIQDGEFLKQIMNKYGDMRDKEAIADMISFGYPKEDAEFLLSAIRAAGTPEDVTAQQEAARDSLKDLRYYTDRDALSRDVPGAVGSVAATIPVALGPVTALGQGANLLVKGNRLSQLIRKIPTKARFVEGSIGLGLPQGTAEYAVRQNPVSTYFASDDLK